MKKLTIDEINSDLSTLENKKAFIKVFSEYLHDIEDFEKILSIEGISEQKNYKTSNRFCVTQGLIEDFPHEEIKRIIKNFLLKKKDSLLSEYKMAFTEFRQKYENIGLDFSDKLKELES